MRDHPSSSSSASSSSTHLKHRKRKLTRQELLKSLEILGTLTAPLPPQLPPSPPASRSTTPALSHKRKPESDVEHSRLKRPRTTSFVDRFHQQHRTLRPEPSEDGEVPEESSSRSAVATIAGPTFVPVRRPRRGKQPKNDPYYETLYDTYYPRARALKYSGDARFLSTHPPTHRDYRPLVFPPPTNSPYHKYGGVIARMELIDSLVCFAYALWAKEYGKGICQRDSWNSMQHFIQWAKSKWKGADAGGEREKAFLGLICMIEGFMWARYVTYSTKLSIEKDIVQLAQLAETKVEKLYEASVQVAIASGKSSGAQQATPPMLPSPASLGTNSANSTPTNNRPDGTPNPASVDGPSANSSSPSDHPSQTPSSSRETPSHPSSSAPPAKVTSIASLMTSNYYPIQIKLATNLRDQSHYLGRSVAAIEESQRLLTLPIMAKHFPKTFSRMIHTSYLPHEEYEPDMEDDEGELFWPGQCITGEGLAWVCCMGRAMVMEFGKEYGYRGTEGMVPKPRSAEDDDKLHASSSAAPKR
ncbi:hypothetical protein JAAARDRAFT_194032 [Jaapia argillacea MUCL 33604]|uniref:Uncharacterized protein n=1 Tax=Jaapia argillacea MUCL 33604 TaxID=933084 RepID=A0A067PV62_9AGAM|nr:hypothetical protein JAAARDRAFT_194032 [Jaapia argillacea MUCL 33604]